MDIGVRAKQEARAELATWQECYRDVAYTEARDLISFGRWVSALFRDRRANAREDSFLLK